MPKKGKGKGRGAGKPKDDNSQDSSQKTPQPQVPRGRGRPTDASTPGAKQTDPKKHEPAEKSRPGAQPPPVSKPPEAGQSSAAAFFGEKQQDFPELSGPKKDTSVRPKVPSKSEQETVLKQLAGLQLEHKSPVLEKAFKMAKRPGYGLLGTRISLYVNYFKLKYKDSSIYHYDIDISEADKSNKKGRSLMKMERTAKEDIEKKVKHVERQKRRNIGKAKCRLIVAELIKSKALKPFWPVYDGQKNLFTCKQLPCKEEESYPVDVTIDDKVKRFFVTVKPVRKEDRTNIISLEPLKELYSGRSKEIPQEVLLVYDTIMNHRDPPFDQVQFRNSFFYLGRMDNVEALGSGLEIWYGYHQSVRLSEEGPVVIINLAAKAFHKAGSVIDYAIDVLNNDITKLPRLQPWQFDTLSSALRGVQVKVTHQKHPRKYKIKGLTKQAAKDLILDIDKKKVSVAQYFLQQYQKKLAYPHLPCLHMQTTTNTTYLPMETCNIVEGQPKIGKLTGELTSKMIRTTAIPPRDRFGYIQSDANNVRKISENYLKAFGLIMDIEMMKVDGRIITAPKIGYGGNKNDPRTTAVPDNRGVWRVEDGKKFYQVTKVDTWVLISFADERQFGYEKLKRYCDFLVKSARKCGMSIDNPKYVKIYQRNTTTEAAISEAKRSGAEFAIVVLNRRDSSHTYDEVKFLADFTYGIVTQCMEDKTIGRINDQITTNVCLKINVKLGGINHILLQKPQVFSKPVIVFGADAIHWTRGYGYPSILAVVGSLNPSASRFALTCELQRNIKDDKVSQEIIRDMENISKDILNAFFEANKIPPRTIIFYRDGVSEGQFQHALDYEVSGLQKACQSLFQQILPITYIVVQKRHQTRFQPVNPHHGVGKCQNIPPGTVVDRSIVHPAFFDYFICSHEGIQGTSKPAHYTVLHDDNHFKADEIQQLSHFLCHTYVKCTRSVSLPAPVLYADLAATRAKKYADLYVQQDTGSVSSDGEEIQRNLPPNVEKAIRSMKSFEKNMFYI